MMVENTGVRGPTLARLAIVSKLLSIENTPALRVTLQARGSLLHELFLSMEFFLRYELLLFEL